MTYQEDGCGSHEIRKDGTPTFDHTCDDCMLPYPHLEPLDTQQA